MINAIFHVNHTVWGQTHSAKVLLIAMIYSFTQLHANVPSSASVLLFIKWADVLPRDIVKTRGCKSHV